MIEKISTYGTLISAIFASGAATNAIATHVKEEADWQEMILGPLGALALALAVIYFTVTYLKSKDKKIDELNDKLLIEKDKQIEALKERVKN